ncbi:MAG: hypothetical protein A4E53_03526 [Pelotomaculum sp. PtaB.Bin104]|nr:MAG: hypothetical protein A4E53_03526 [Pelotomaculum sp. PtaB.Bin104]
MNDILNLVLLQDIISLPKEILQDMATDLNIPTNLSTRELAVSIWQSNRGQYKTFNCVRNRILGGRTSVTWYQLDENQSLTGAKEVIIENCQFNPFEEIRIPDAEELTNTPILIGGAYGDSEEEYYLRFMYKSGVTQSFHGTRLYVQPNSAVKTIYVNEDKNCIEVRTDARVANKFARGIAQLLRQQISVSAKDILAPFGNNIEGIADALNGELIDATAIPEDFLLESLTEEQAEALMNILSALDEYFQEGDIDQLSRNLQLSRETFGNDLVSVPFTALILSGLNKIAMGGSRKDLRLSSPLYNTFRPHVQNQGGFIRFSIQEDGVINPYTIKVGLNTKSVYFLTQASEAAIKYVRGKLL